MIFKCPHCGQECDFLEVKADENLAAIIRMQQVFGAEAYLVWAYAELFGIVPFRAKARKLRVIMEEMKRLFESGEFTYNKKSYRISRKGIAEALAVVVKRHFSERLSNHNYLKKVMIPITEREAGEASHLAEVELRRREELLQAGIRNQEEVLPKIKDVPPAHLTDEEIEENRRRLREMLQKIG